MNDFWEELRKQKVLKMKGGSTIRIIEVPKIDVRAQKRGWRLASEFRSDKSRGWRKHVRKQKAAAKR